MEEKENYRWRGGDREKEEERERVGLQKIKDYEKSVNKKKQK